MSRTTEHYIFLGYDIMRQCTWALHDGSLIRIDDADNPRIPQVINGLCDVGRKLKPHEMYRTRSEGAGEPEVVLIVQNPWQVQVDYSDQAWDDLLEIGRLV